MKLFGHFCLLLALTACTTVPKQAQRKSPAPDYSSYVWPPPPDEARIRLVDIIHGRMDVEPRSSFEKALIGSSPQSPWDLLNKPFGAELDREKRILVTDPGLSALLRFDRENHAMDVLGVKGSLRLKTPLGLCIGPEGKIYVADAGLKKIVMFSPDGEVVGAFGHQGELENPTDAVLSPDGERLYVTDSKAHRIVVFDIASGKVELSFGSRGTEPGQFNYPSALDFSSHGDLIIVDQMNSRLQVLTAEGEALDSFGGLGTGFGDFVRPKDVTVSREGLVFVTDAAFGNVQIFDPDFRLLTFVGENGRNPGQFQLPGGVAVRDGYFVIVDQLNRRIQLFRLLETSTGA